MRRCLPNRIQFDILFADFCGKSSCRDQENAKADVALARSLSLKAPHKDQMMSVSAIPPLPAFQPLNSRLGTNNNNDNNRDSANGPNGPNGANGSNHSNRTNTGHTTGQARGPGPNDGADNGAQTTGTAATQTSPPNQQTQPHQTIQGTGLTLNILV